MKIPGETEFHIETLTQEVEENTTERPFGDTKLKFKDAYNKAIEKMVSGHPRPIIIGNYCDFDIDELNEDSEDCFKFFIDFGLIYLLVDPSPQHEFLIEEIKDIINFAFRNFHQTIGGICLFKGYGSSSIEMINVFGCGAVFAKSPDSSWGINPKYCGLRTDPSLVLEHSFSNESLHILLVEAECYLNDLTHVPYFIGMKFININKVMFFLCGRKNPQKFFKNKKEKENFKKNMLKKKRINRCGL